jgi:hypothetical protein
LPLLRLISKKAQHSIESNAGLFVLELLSRSRGRELLFILRLGIRRYVRTRRPGQFQRPGETMHHKHLAALAFVGLSLAATTSAQEKKIKRSDLPPAVEKTVAAQSAGATIKGFSTEKENGQTLFEVELTVNGHSKDISMATDGSIVEIEEQVALDSLSPEVQAGLQAKVGKGKILKVESLTKKDKIVAYEAQVETNGKKSEVQVGPDGKPLAHEE